jgi:hypothetical protein
MYRLPRIHQFAYVHVAAARSNAFSTDFGRGRRRGELVETTDLLAASQIVADIMEALGMPFRKPSVDLAAIRRKYHAAEREEEKEARQK